MTRVLVDARSNPEAVREKLIKFSITSTSTKYNFRSVKNKFPEVTNFIE